MTNKNESLSPIETRAFTDSKTHQDNLKKIQEIKQINAKTVSEIKELEARQKQLTDKKNDLEQRALGATDAGLVATAGNKLPVEPFLKLAKLVSGYEALLTILQPVKALKAKSVYTTGIPTLSAFASPYDGVNSIAEANLAVNANDLTSATYASFATFSNEILFDSGIDLDSYVKAIHAVMVAQKHEQVAVEKIVASTLTQVATVATTGTVVTSDIQGLYNKLSSPVRKDAVFIVSDALETVLAGLTLGGLPLLRYSDEMQLPMMLGKPVFFQPSMVGTNNGVILADLGAITVQPFSNGDEVFKVEQASSAFVQDQSVYRLLTRFDCVVDKEGSTAVLNLA